MGKISGYFEKHQERAFIVKAVLIISLILLTREYLTFFFFYLLLIVIPFMFFSFALAWSAYSGDALVDIIKRNVTLLPGIYSDEKKKGEHLPVVTYSIVFINIAIFYIIQQLLGDEVISNNFLFLPYEPNFWNTPVSLFSSMFLHGSDGHLWGNMFFLWGVGTEVERRVGPKQFLLLYLITGVLAGLIFVSANYLFLGEVGHALGASGAISGIMGVFAVRCYFKTMVFPFPILGILPISFKIRMNSIVMMGLFFMMDLQDGIEKLSGAYVGNVAHWAHLGGMMAGFFIAACMKLGRSAMEERHRSIGLERLKEGVGLGEGEASLRRVLESKEEDVEAILALARTKSRKHGFKYTLTKEGAELYRKAISLLISADPKQAAEVYVEYFNKYQEGIEPALQFRIAGILYRKGDLDRAGKALELLVDADNTPAAMKEKALFQAAKIMEDMDLDDAARMYYERFLESFPQSDMAPKVQAKLGLA